MRKRKVFYVQLELRIEALEMKTAKETVDAIAKDVWSLEGYLLPGAVTGVIVGEIEER